MSTKEKGLDALMKKMNASIGEKAVVKLGDADRQVDRLSSGSMEIDYVLGGGWAVGRMHEIFGGESSGKTTICLHTIAECQANGGTAMFIDAEHALDPEWAKTIGVNIDELIFVQPDYGEQALEIADQFAASGEVDLIIIDSVANLIPKTELEGEMGDQAVGKQAKMMAQACRKLPVSAQKGSCTIIFINQTRQKIGVTFGSDVTTPGGNALKFAVSQRLEIWANAPKTESDGSKLSRPLKAKCIKNKVSAPFLQSETRIAFGIGIDTVWEVLELAIELEIVKKGGSWYSMGESKLGQGEKAVLEFLREDEDTFNAIKHLVQTEIQAQE